MKQCFSCGNAIQMFEASVHEPTTKNDFHLKCFRKREEGQAPKPVLRQTHTYAVLEVSLETWNDIVARLRAVNELETYCQSGDEQGPLLVFGTVALRAVMDENPAAWLDTPAAQEVLEFLTFDTGPLAHLFRDANGADIPRQIEKEQAFILRWMLKLVFKHGDKWREFGKVEIRAATEKVEGKKKP